MSRSQFVLTSLMLVALSSSTALAQKGRPPARAPGANAKAAVVTRGQQPASSKASANAKVVVPEAQAGVRGDIKRSQQAAGAQGKVESKREERSEHEAFKAARGQSSGLLKGIKLSRTQRQQVNDIRKKYDDQYKTLEKQERDADKAKQPDTQILAQLQTVRDQERTELRAALTPSQVSVFDRNATRKSKKG